MDIIITGVSRGIGYATAVEALRYGKNRVLGLSRDASCFEKLTKVASETDSTFHGLKADLIHDYYLPTLINMLVTLNFSPRILINNAAVLIKKTIAEMTEGDFERCFRLNVWAPYRLIQALLPYIPAESHIVNISSMGGVQGSKKYPGMSIYSASKAALISLTESLAEELTPMKIRVNAIAPGTVKTQMLNEAFPNDVAEITAEEAATYIWQFASTAYPFMNGKIIPMSVSNP